MEDAARRSRRNGAIPDEVLTRLLARLRDLHPADKPLVQADYLHALDAWQWTLRLDPGAGAAVQIAALFHDVERIFTEAESRSEQNVSDYDGYKARHAARSAWITAALLREEKIDSALAERVVALIAGHDQHGRVEGDSDAVLLEDADALSFFSLNSPGYLGYYGEEQTRRKVEWTFARLSHRGREALAGLELPPEVAVLLPTAVGVRRGGAL
jgi:predicted metal-dependent HD superfamily phosphohydrolase